MKIGGNSNKKCKDRLGKPKIGPETEKIGEKRKKTTKEERRGGQKGPRSSSAGTATVVLSGARGLPNKYLKILRYKELRTEGTEGLVLGI